MPMRTSLRTLEIARLVREEDNAVSYRRWMRGALLALSTFSIGCDSSTSSSPIPPPTGADFYVSVPVSGGKFAIGFANGTLRSSRDVAKFSILRHPVTVGQFRACVAAGACRAPRENACLTSIPGEINHPNYATGVERAPVTCVEPDG